MSLHCTGSWSTVLRRRIHVTALHRELVYCIEEEDTCHCIAQGVGLLY
jgi:hypothetical protein